MLPISIRPSRVALGVLIVAIGAQACSDATDPSLGAAFTLALGAPALSLASGTSANTSIKATRRGGLTSPITYAVTGAPVGLAASVANTNQPDSSTLTIVAVAALGPGTYPLVVTATATGAATQQAPLTVTVTAGAAPSISLVVTGGHTCALATTGAAYCWGYNGSGQLGNGQTGIVNSTPVAVAGGLTFQSLAVSRVDPVSCGLTTDGAAYCWGENNEGEVGDGTTTGRLTPTAVSGGLKFKSLAVGDGFSCALTADGTAYCWGFSATGAFGDGSVGLHLTPTVAAPGMKFNTIAVGGSHTCGIALTGATFCWGLGLSGELGTGLAVETNATPVAVTGGLAFQSIIAGGKTTCALTVEGKAYCWGYDFYGTVGDGSSGTTDGVTRRLAPVPVSGGLTFQSLSAGYETVCGVTPAGVGYCWGYNASGGVGDGTLEHRPVPTLVASGLTFKSISAGTGISCGITTASAAYCWGDNSNGDLGDGTTISRPTPGPVRF